MGSEMSVCYDPEEPSALAVLQVPSWMRPLASDKIMSIIFLAAVDIALSRDTAMTHPQRTFLIGAAETSPRTSNS